MNALDKTVQPKVETSAMDTAISKARELKGLLDAIGASADGAASGAVNLSRTSFSDT